ncbi:proteophosphoglycan ppg4 [Angomonas deanei]|uniref:Uncharacterized protein n=1 Tax=Angomonas deanei TaxID=59799 RepID=A0A7G2CQQ8_9TRYP|nr:proteophosphoglycan ppg4 [Angomonas deanei]CAD2221719.1 hypothetical protein, conserved [Angomonas deanei]|eukprot:EPY21798.1 proteophosphoglycan ppg4 [Angomonas deanei]
MASPAALEGSVWREGAPDPVRVIPAPSSEMNLADLPAAGWAPVYMNCWQSPDFHRRASDYEFQDGSPIPNAPVKEERKGSDSDSDDELFTKTTTRREGSVSRLSMSFSLADRSMQSPLPVDHSIVQNINRRLSMSSSTLWNAPNQRFGQSFIGVPSTPLNQSTRSSAWGSPNLHRTDASPLPTAPEETMPNERESSPSRCSAADSSVRPSTLMTSMSFQRSRQTEGAVFDNSNSIPLSASVVSGARWQVTNSRRTSDATTYTSLGASQQHFSGESQRSKMTTSFRTTYCRKAAAVDGLPLTRGALGQSTRGSLASSQKPRQLHQDPHKKAKKKETTPTRRTNTTTDQPDTSVFLPWSPLTITPDCSVNFLNSTVATEPPSPAPKTKEEEVPSVPASFNGSAGGVFEGFLRDAVSSMTGDQRPSTSISTTSTTEGLFSAEALRAMQQMSADGNVQLASFLQESMFSSYRRSGAPGRPSHVSEQSMMMGATMNQYSMSMAASTATHTEEPEPTAVVADENSNARRTVSSKRQPSLQQRASTNIVVPLSEKVTPSVTEELEYMTVDEQESVGI